MLLSEYEFPSWELATTRKFSSPMVKNSQSTALDGTKENVSVQTESGTEQTFYLMIGVGGWTVTPTDITWNASRISSVGLQFGWM